ncbi:hypothetical protein GCM10009535_31120 [Streptomyces thermocarboxydovorans]|uniref:Uncharacterized protein n=1 Tax=Streptomyces thermocarboxydovorans TaxID=59298 RepID=A0ABP3SM06_9ACTN
MERLLRLGLKPAQPCLHPGPRHLAPLDREQRLALLARLDHQPARAQQVADADQQTQQMHRVLPARGAVVAQVRLQLAALAAGVAGEGLVDPPGEERPAQRQQLPAGVVGVLHERGVQALQDVRIGAQRQLAEALQLPAELVLARTLDMRRRLVQLPEQGRGREEHTPAVGVAALRGRPEGARSHDAAVDGVIAHQQFGRQGRQGRVGAHAPDRREGITRGGSNFRPP